MWKSFTKAGSFVAGIALFVGGLGVVASPAQAAMVTTVATVQEPSCYVRYDNVSDSEYDLYSFEGPAVRLNAPQTYHWHSHLMDHVLLPQDVEYNSATLPARRTKHNVTDVDGYIIDSNNGFRVDCVKYVKDTGGGFPTVSSAVAPLGMAVQALAAPVSSVASVIDSAPQGWCFQPKFWEDCPPDPCKDPVICGW